MREIVLIEAPSNLGLAPPSPGVEPGTKLFSQELLKTGFAEKVGITEKVAVLPLHYSTDIDEESKVRNADAISSYSQRLATVVANSIHAEKKTLVIGGDCSILIGVALGLKRTGNFALFFIDGHTDYVLPHQSGSQGAAGMDLAIITGNGHNKVTNIEGQKPYIEEENVFCFGNRDVSEEWYVHAIKQSNITYFDLPMLRDRGIQTITGSFLHTIKRKKVDGFWIHFDVDVLDDAIMPCVDSRQPGGLSYAELSKTLAPLLASPYFAGMNVTIFDPSLDKEGKYIREFSKEFSKIIKTANKKLAEL